MSSAAAKWKGVAWIVGALALTFIFAGGLTLLVNLIPYSTEARWASHLPSFSEGACDLSPESSAALEKLRKRLSLPSDGDLEIHLHIVESSEVNAFAFLGGQVFLNSALLDEAESAEEVAGVLAHEISHVKNRDVLHAIAGQLVTGLLLAQVGDSTVLTKIFTQVAGLRFTRKQEEAADQGALERLKASHISTQPLARFFKRLQSTGVSVALLSDHPNSDARAKLAESTNVPNPTPVLSDDEWTLLKATCRQ